MADDGRPGPTPLTIIGGYLGAGKTTLVNHLLRSAEGLRLAVLVNEFGALAIDADLIESRDGNVLSIAGGCVCCSYGNDLVLSLQELGAGGQSFDHVLLEASGVAIPSAIAATVSLIPGFVLDGIVVLADAETIEAQVADRYMGDTVRAQLRDSDLILLNKADLVSGDALARVEGWLGETGKCARIVTTVRGEVPTALVLGSFVGRDRGAPKGSHPEHDVAGWASELVDVPAACDPEAFAAGLVEAGYIRAKGFVADTAGAMWTVQVVGARAEVGPAPGDVTPGVVGIRLRIA